MLALALSLALLGQSLESAPVRNAGADGSLDARSQDGHRDFWPSRDGQLGDLVFRAPLVPGGTDALPAPICINGVCKDPICRYRAKDATATSWPAWGFGETLTKVEVGADTVDEDLPHLGRGEKGRRFGGADYYESATAGACDIGTEDFVIEAIVRTGHDVAGSRTFAGKWGGASGWMLYRSGGLLYSYINQGGLLNLNPGYSASGTLLHVLVGYDRNYASGAYGARFAINGVNVANQDASSKAATLTNAEKFTIGGTAAGLQTDGAVLYFAIYKQADWLPGTAANATILDAIAADRSARFWGVREEVNGIAPTMTTAGPRCAWTPAGKLDCYSASAHILGATFPPGAGTIGGVDHGGGLMVAASRAQALLYSREFLTGWTLTGTTPVAASGVTSPFIDARTVYAITDDAAGAEEYISQTLDITAMATGSVLALCPIAAVASGTQLYTVSVTEQTGASCTTTTTHYKPTATTTWQQQEQRHTVLDGDCTQAVITVRPYDVASGVAATGAVTVLMNAQEPVASTITYCSPFYIETTSAAVTPTSGAMRYATPYNAALGQRQVNDSGNAKSGTRVWRVQVLSQVLAAASPTSRAANDSQGLVGPNDGNDAAFALRGNGGRAVFDYDYGYKHLCATLGAASTWADALYVSNFDRDLYQTGIGRARCSDTTPNVSGHLMSFTEIGATGGLEANSNETSGAMLRNAEVYR